MKPGTRFPTSDTSLAACLGALRIPIQSLNPVTLVIDETGVRRRFTYWFEPKGAQFLGQDFEADDIAWAFKHREEFEAGEPEHPLIPMRRALDANGWLLKVAHGSVHPIQTPGRSGFRTENIMVAACAKASGLPLLRYEGNEFHFSNEPRFLLRDFEKYDWPEFLDRPFALMRRVLEVRKLLVTLAKHPDIVPMREYVVGDPLDGGKVAHIPVGLPQDQVDLLLRELYA